MDEKQKIWGAQKGSDGTVSDEVMDPYLRNPSTKRYVCCNASTKTNLIVDLY